MIGGGIEITVGGRTVVSFHVSPSGEHTMFPLKSAKRNSATGVVFVAVVCEMAGAVV